MAIEIKLSKLAEVLGAEVAWTSLQNDVVACGITTDSREVCAGGIFVARRGEKDDGHAYIARACGAGASVVIAEKGWLSTLREVELAGYPSKHGFAVIAVKEATLALGELAKFWRQELNLPTIAITGSVGKSTTKEIVASLLERLIGQGTSNKKSFNNNVGLPLTVLSSSRTDKWMLLEAGMNHAGELDYLARIAQPDIAVILNVEAVHLEYFPNIAGIADAKCELLRGLRPGGKVVLRKENAELLAGVSREETRQGRSFEKVYFGQTPGVDYLVRILSDRGLAGLDLEIEERKDGLKVRSAIPHLGVHNAWNACGAVAAVMTAFPDLKLEAIAEVLPQARKAGMRLEIKEVAGRRLVVDCYNANPLSMRAAFQTVKEIAQEGKFALVLGDMRELGTESPQYHVDLGKDAASLKPEYIVAIGGHADDISAGAKSLGYHNIRVATTMDEVARLVLERTDVSLVLFKASRGIELEKAVYKLEEKLNAIPSSISAS